MTTEIYLYDVQATLTVPLGVLPAANNGSMDTLAAHLGSLYLSGMTASDSYDVGLSIIGEDPIPVIGRVSSDQRKQLRKERNAELETYVKF